MGQHTGTILQSLVVGHSTEYLGILSSSLFLCRLFWDVSEESVVIFCGDLERLRVDFDVDVEFFVEDEFELDDEREDDLELEEYLEEDLDDESAFDDPDLE